MAFDGLLRFRTALIAAVAGVFLFGGGLQAQPGLEAYDRGDLQAVRLYLEETKAETAEILFLRAAMTTDADSAVELYRKVVLAYPEAPLSQRALDRIRQYFYAQGNDDKAAEFEKTLKDYHPPTPRLEDAGTPLIGAEPPSQAMKSSELDSAAAKARIVGYYLQVGAFSSAANANKLKSILQKAGYQVEIVGAERSANRLHTVRVAGLSTEQEAQAAAEDLRQRHRLKPILVPILERP